MRDDPSAGVVHQAAHAVAAACFGTPVPSVDPTPGASNCADLSMPSRPSGRLDRPTEFALKAHAVVFLAGLAAELKIKGEQLDPVAESHPDAVHARQVVGWMLVADPSRVSGYLRGELTITTRDFLQNWHPSISDVVAAALREGPIGAQRIRELVAPAIEHRRRLSAYHEAGHAVILWLEGNGQIPLSVGIGDVPIEGGQNWTIVRKFSSQFHLLPVATDVSDRELAQRELERVVAGEEAASLVDPTYPGKVLAWADREEAQRLASKLAHEARQELAEKVEAEARAIVRRQLQDPKTRALVEALVSALLERSPLGEDEIRDLFTGVSAQEDS